jgi:hypothetical protein
LRITTKITRNETSDSGSPGNVYEGNARANLKDPKGREPVVQQVKTPSSGYEFITQGEKIARRT